MNRPTVQEILKRTFHTLIKNQSLSDWILKSNTHLHSAYKKLSLYIKIWKN